MKTQRTFSPNLNREGARSFVLFSLIGLCILFYSNQLYALSWTINRTLQAQEIYSDNIRLSPSGLEQGAFVTAVNPGVSIIAQSARSRLNFNYRMQNLYNGGGNGGFNIYNQLQSNSHNTFITNKLFLDSNTSISQQNINNFRPGADNINGGTNSTSVYTFGLSPYWTPHFGNYAYGTARLNFNTIATGTNSSSIYNSNLNPSLNTISDSVNLAETIYLNNGAYFQRVRWNLSFNNNENYRINSPNVSFQNTNGRVSTSINQKFSVFAQGGYSNNNYQSTTNSNHNGAYYTVGGQWQPSQRYSLTAGGGNNSYVTFYVSPMQRLNWTTTYSHNAVGTNFGQYSAGNPGGNTGVGNSGQYSGINGGGNSGSNWQTALNYRTRNSTWNLSHINTTTTSQQILAQNQVFPNQNLTDNQILNAVPDPRIINNPNLNNEVIVTKRWNLSVSYLTGKSTFTANAYDQDYTYQISGNNQTLIGVGGAWNWRFASQTSAYLRPLWQMTENHGSANNTQYYTVIIGVNKAITSRLNGILEFRHITQTSSGNSITTPTSFNNVVNDYQENRATASLNMRF